MARLEGEIRCDGCGIEITWAPIRSAGGEYCCEDCSQGRPCECGARQETDEHDAYPLPV